MSPPDGLSCGCGGLQSGSRRLPWEQGAGLGAACEVAPRRTLCHRRHFWQFARHGFERTGFAAAIAAVSIGVNQDPVSLGRLLDCRRPANSTSTSFLCDLHTCLHARLLNIFVQQKSKSVAYSTLLHLL